MSVQTVTRKGKRYFLVEETEYRRLFAEAAAGLPPLPRADAQGNRPAVAFARVSISRQVISQRKSFGLSRAELARQAGIRAETLNRLEKAKHTPDEGTMKRIEAVFKNQRRLRVD